MNVLSWLKHSTFHFAKILFWASSKFLHQIAYCCPSFLTIHPRILSHFFLTIIDSSAIPIIQLKLLSHLAPIPATSSLTHHLSPTALFRFSSFEPSLHLGTVFCWLLGPAVSWSPSWPSSPHHGPYSWPVGRWSPMVFSSLFSNTL